MTVTNTFFGRVKGDNTRDDIRGDIRGGIRGNTI